MKSLPLLAGCALLSLSSCSLFSKKDKEDLTIGDQSIPPPANLQASNETTTPQEELPELPSTPEQGDRSVAGEKVNVNVKEIDGFKFKNVLDDLPSQRELASPPASLTPSVPKTEGSQSPEDETKPLVSNP